MSDFTRNQGVSAVLETTLALGAGCLITIGAAVAGVLPTVAPAVANGGTGYPASSTLNVFFIGSGGYTATGTITTSVAGVVTAATVTNGGVNYTNAAPASFAIEGATLSPGTWCNGQAGSWANSIPLFGEVGVKINNAKVQRMLLRSYYGAGENLPGPQYATVTFTTELGAGGVAGGRPGWSRLIRAAGFAETFYGTNPRVAYTPVSLNLATASLMIEFGQTRLDIRGARVEKMEMDFTVGQVPTCKWTVSGLIQAYVAIGYVGAPDTTSWQPGVVILDANTGDIRFGCTLGVSALVGGTGYVSNGMRVTIDNTTIFRPMLGTQVPAVTGGDSMVITDRDVAIETTLDQVGADRQTFYNNVRNHVVQSMGFSVGNTAGTKFRLFAPNAEPLDWDNVNDQGQAFCKYTFNGVPTPPTGNDELTIVVA
jgi:hypothetical protein